MCSFRGIYGNRGNGTEQASPRENQTGSRSQDVRFGEEEGDCGCGVFAAFTETAETERSRLLRERTKPEVARKTSGLERKKETADVEFSRHLRKPRKRNGAGFF